MHYVAPVKAVAKVQPRTLRLLAVLALLLRAERPNSPA